MSGTKLTAVDTLPHLLPAKLPILGGWIFLPFTGGLIEKQSGVFCRFRVTDCGKQSCSMNLNLCLINRLTLPTKDAFHVLTRCSQVHSQRYKHVCFAVL